MKHLQLTILPYNKVHSVENEMNLKKAILTLGYPVNSPCGGHGTCKKCMITILKNGEKLEVLACQTFISSDITVILPEKERTCVMIEETESTITMAPLVQNVKYLMAFDIGTTTIACFLLDGRNGQTLASCGMLNPQFSYGSDVVSRVQYAIREDMMPLTEAVRQGLNSLMQKTADMAGVLSDEIGLISIVGNPCMEQLFLGIIPQNLASPPFEPVLREVLELDGAEYLDTKAKLLILPNISGYVGADTLGCVLSTGMYDSDIMTLMVDIGTNGEMVLGNRRGMIACSTAAGPALEGANIKCGMRGAKGAVDHVWLENDKICYSTIENALPVGICGSGLIDAVAVMNKIGVLNKRGRIQTSENVNAFYADRLITMDNYRAFFLCSKANGEPLYLDQQDVREVQLAKGAIAAGIELMAKQLNINVGEIERVLMAGAFGSYVNPHSACVIGLLPLELENKITAVGNAAGAGAKMVACNKDNLYKTQALRNEIRFLELASVPEFQHCFGKNISFRE